MIFPSRLRSRLSIIRIRLWPRVQSSTSTTKGVEKRKLISSKLTNLSSKPIRLVSPITSRSKDLVCKVLYYNSRSGWTNEDRITIGTLPTSRKSATIWSPPSIWMTTRSTTTWTSFQSLPCLRTISLKRTRLTKWDLESLWSNSKWESR